MKLVLSYELPLVLDHLVVLIKTASLVQPGEQHLAQAIFCIWNDYCERRAGVSVG